MLLLLCSIYSTYSLCLMPFLSRDMPLLISPLYPNPTTSVIPSMHTTSLISCHIPCIPHQNHLYLSSLTLLTRNYDI